MKIQGLWLAAAALSVAFGCAAPTKVPAEPAIESESMTSELKAPEPTPRVVVYASEREQLHALSLDPMTGELSPTTTVSLPEQVHYAAADAGARSLYVSTSDGSGQHGLYAFAIDPATGALVQRGQPLVPPLGRIIHLDVDPSGRHLVLAHNKSAQLSSVRLDADGSLAGFVEQAAPAETGFFTHQALLDPTGTRLVACGLGADATDGAPEQPGSLTLFHDEDGRLTRQQTVLPGPGLGPRHLDYAGDHVFVAMERGNRLFVYRYENGELAERPEFDVTTLRNPAGVRPGQRAGAIHLHPSGKYLYVSNRANRTKPVEREGQSAEVFAGGENDIALFALEPGSGEPHAIEHYDTRGFEPRTFAIDPSGRFLIVANQATRDVVDASGRIRSVPRSLVVFAIEEGGRLSYRHQYEFTRGDIFWLGSLQLPG